jgi:hypothetical protein
MTSLCRFGFPHGVSDRFADETIDAIVRLLGVAQLPVLRTVRTKMLRWVTTLAEAG